MTDDEIRAVTMGRTVRSVNLVTGFEATLHYGADGNRSLMGLGDRLVVTPYEIRVGSRGVHARRRTDHPFWRGTGGHAGDQARTVYRKSQLGGDVRVVLDLLRHSA